MPIKFTTKGFIELWRGTTKVSQHTIESEAVERATADSEKTKAVLYTLKYPNKEIDLSTLSRVVFDPDTLAPTAPVISASAASQTSISVALVSASTDVQSGIASYRIEYKRTVDSTWSVGTAAIGAPSFPFTITGLTASTAYDVRCRATDGASNVGPFSAVSSATTPASVSPPVWSTVPTITFVQGVAANIDISSYDSKGSTDTITHTAGTFPAGVTYNQALKRYEYDGAGAAGGTNGHILTADDAALATFAVRRNTGRVIYSTDFSQASDFTATTKVFGQAPQPGEQPASYWRSLVTQDTTDPRLSRCLKINSPASTGSNGAAWFTSLNPGGFPGTSALGGAWTQNSQGLAGIPFYVQLRLKVPATRFIGRSGHPYQGWKFFDVSAYSPVDPEGQSQSNTGFECIGQVQHANASDGLWNTPESYHQPGYTSFYEQFFGNISGTGYYQHTRRDNGAAITDPLQRYCLINSSTEVMSAGCFRFSADQWYTIDLFINAQSINGSAGNQYKMWITPQDGTTRTLLYDESNFTFNSDPRFTGGHCGLWLNAYETALDVPSGVDTYQKWGEVIVSLDPIVLPAVGT